MANQGRRPMKRGSGAPVRRGASTSSAQKNTAQKNQKAKKKVVFDAPAALAEESRTFRLGVVPGATPGKWIDAWKQRMPHVALEVVPVEVADQRAAIGGVDAALIRLPLDDADLHIITLYDETPVVVAATDSHLLAADELTIADLAGEVLLPLTDSALPPHEVPGSLAPAFAAMRTDEAIATAASGVGAVIVPMSLARLHHRKDVDYRPLVDGPISTVALAWSRDRTTPDVETFVGIVRGRTINSSR